MDLAGASSHVSFLNLGKLTFLHWAAICIFFALCTLLYSNSEYEQPTRPDIYSFSRSLM